MAHFIIGLTGGIGSGKTAVSDAFADLGVAIVDADVIAREVVSPGSEGLAAIVERYGETILEDTGELDRRALRNKVFSDESERQWLNNLTHPLIRNEMIRQCTEATGDYALMVAPLLVENGLQSLVHRVLVVDVPESVQVSRTANRDGTTPEQVKQILARQVSRQERLAAADDVFDNTGAANEIPARVKDLDRQYRQLAKDSSSAQDL